MQVTTSEVVKPRRGKTRKPRSLLLLLKSFVGLRVRINLKNDSVIEGVVQEVVNDMDFTLLDACETKPTGATVMLDEVFVMGKTVLCVHIPDRINISHHLQQYVRLVQLLAAAVHAELLIRYVLSLLKLADSNAAAECNDVYKGKAHIQLGTVDVLKKPQEGTCGDGDVQEVMRE